MLNKKLISLCLAAAMTASAVPTSVFAASIGSSSTDANIGEDTAQSAQTSYAEIFKNNNETQVYLTIDDKDRVVSLPTTVVLSGAPDAQGKYIGKYSVGVSGDMSGKKIVKVEPEATASLTQRGKNNVTAFIAQDQVSFNTDDFKNKTVTNGSVFADSLTAGSWNSNFNFNVSTEVNGVPAGYTLLYKYDLSATEQDNVAAYYCVPKENTEEIEIPNKTSEQTKNSITSMISSLNLFKPITAYAADNNVVESNGVRYTLSDEDTFVITGNGAMKPEVYKGITDYSKLKKDVYAHFPQYPEYNDLTELHDGIHYNWLWGENKLYPYFVTCRSKDGKLEKDVTNEIKTYIDTIKQNYDLKFPKNVIIENGVTNISDKAFYECEELRNVEIADSVESIGKDAFYYCQGLKELKLPKNLKKLGDGCFSSNYNLTRLDIPASVETMNPTSSFDRMEQCKEINVSPDNKYYSSIDGVVYNKDKTELLCCPGAKTSIELPETLKKIDTGACSYCSYLTEIVIPEGVTEIKADAFCSCPSLNSVQLPNSLTKIGMSAFSNCNSLAHINIPDGIQFDYVSGSLYNYDIFYNTQIYKDQNNWQDGVLYIDNVAVYYDKDKLPENISIRANTRYIFPYLFNNNKNLKNITLSESVKKINDREFYNCTNLVSVTIPDGIVAIGEFAFNGCAGLENINIPNSVTSIGRRAFIGCTNLTNVYIPDSVKSIDEGAFYNLKNGSKIYCQSQAVADLLKGGTKYNSSKTTVVVDASKF